MNTTITLPQPPHLPGMTWRAGSIADAPAFHRFQLAIDATDDRHWAGTLVETEQMFSDPDSHPPTDTLLAFTGDGEIIAFAWAFTPRLAETEWRSFLRGNVHPQYRRRGLGSFILGWLEVRGRQILAERPGDKPRLLRTYCQDSEYDRKVLFAQHGFQSIRYFFEMTRDLSQPIAPAVLPDGLSFQPWSSAFDEAGFDAFNDAFRDHWGYEPLSPENWNMWFVGSESFRRDLSYVVLDGDRVIGLSLNVVEPETNARSGRNEGWIGDLAVRRPWRKRGVATALLNHAMRAFAASGLTYATLGVDTENPTGALGVYERVGFTPRKRTIAYGKYMDGVMPATEGEDSLAVLA